MKSQLEYIFSVSEINEALARHLELLGQVRVRGEISQFKISQNKFVYITIKDNRARLEIFGLVWKLKNLRSIEEGMEVVVTGTPSLWQAGGKLSIQAESIEPVGAGALDRAYQLLLKQLTEEGLLEPGRKKTLPEYPNKVGLITGLDSQAFLDFTTISSQRAPWVEIEFIPTLVQGKQAVESITRSLDYMENRNLDALVITRGGGSAEDLQAFNQETVVRKIASCRLPTIVAIGHQGDVSLAELVADRRAATPSNAAEILMPDQNQVLKLLDHHRYQLANLITSKLNQRHQVLERNINRFASLIKYRVQQATGLTRRLIQQQHQLRSQIYQSAQSCDQLQTQLRSRLKYQYQQKQLRWQHLDQRLQLQDINANLKRGYSLITNQQGQIINQIDQVSNQDTITNHLADGTIKSTVNQTEAHVRQ